MQHFFRSIPDVGNVAVSRTAQARVQEHGITEEEFENTLFHPERKTPDGANIELWERGGVRLVVNLRPEPFKGAALVTTVYRVEPTLRTRTPARDRTRG